MEFERDAVVYVASAIEQLNRKWPFRPYYVDQAGFHCSFLESISREDVTTFWIDFMALEWVWGGLEGIVSRFHTDEEILDDIFQKQGFSLWWD